MMMPSKITLTLEHVVDHEISQRRIALVRSGNVLEESRANDAATTPDAGDVTIVLQESKAEGVRTTTTREL